MSLCLTAHNNKEGGIKKSFGRQKMLGTAKPSGVIFFGTKGEDRNSFVSIHRNKFAVQKQRLSDGAMKKRTLGEAENKEKGSTEIKEEYTATLFTLIYNSQVFRHININPTIIKIKQLSNLLVIKHIIRQNIYFGEYNIN